MIPEAPAPVTGRRSGVSPAPMARVWAHFQQHAANHAQLVSNSFGIVAVPPQQRLPLNGPLQKELLIWRHNHGHR